MFAFATARSFLAIALIGLGIVGLVVGDFALQWQPVPPDLPGRTALAYVAAALLALGGGTLLLPRWQRGIAFALGVFFAAWAIVLHGPRIVAHPGEVAIWLGFAEIFAVACACFMLADTIRVPARIAFGLCCLVFGASHFVYAKFTAAMVPAFMPAMPYWTDLTSLPDPEFWAYLTGAGHIGAGLALISGVWARAASLLLALMFTVFVVLLHIPRVAADPVRAEWTALAIAAVLCASAWVVAVRLLTTQRLALRN